MTLIRFYPLLKGRDNGWEPDVDILETQDDFVINAELPGLKREELSLIVEDHTLTLKGEKKRESDEKEESYNLNERGFGKFHRRFALPDSVNPKKIKSSLRDGILRVDIPKSEAVKEKEIEVDFK